MNTSHKGSLAEQAVTLEALKRGWGVLKPVGDYFPYDLVFDIEGTLVKIQVKFAWFDEVRQNHVVDNRRTKTNRSVMIREAYTPADFDFAIAYLQDLNLFYIFPVDVFISYASEIHLVETEKRQRKPRSVNFRGAWELISQWAAHKETDARTSVKFGEAGNEVIPSQALLETPA